MKLIIFTRATSFLPRVPQKGKKSLDVEVLPFENLRPTIPSLTEDDLAYLDVRGLSAKELTRALAVIPEHPHLAFGIFDPAGTVTDVAALFHAGAVDYVGKKLSFAAFTARRIEAVAQYAKATLPGSAGSEASTDEAEGPAAESRDGWRDIVPGREYRFAFLYIEVDDAEELKKRYEQENLAGAMESFRGYVERVASRHNGRLWIWSRFGGLVLFPLQDGAAPAVLCGLRILLSRVFYDVEESRLPGRLCFRMALSVGSTVYHEVETGKIISDGINSIFHLGQRFARPGQFLLTAEAAELVPQKLREYLAVAGSFEGRRIMRMLQPVAAAAPRPPDLSC